MTDIVERLRRPPAVHRFLEPGKLIADMQEEQEEAADEIERLRAALDQFKGLPPGEYVHTGDMTSSIVIAKEALGDE